MKAQIWNHSVWIKETDPNTIKNRYTEQLIESGFEVLNIAEHYFKPVGYTALWLLGEIHFAVHTFPEENKSYIELSSCNEDFYNLFTQTEEGATP